MNLKVIGGHVSVNAKVKVIVSVIKSIYSCGNVLGSGTFRADVCLCRRIREFFLHIVMMAQNK